MKLKLVFEHFPYKYDIAPRLHWDTGHTEHINDVICWKTSGKFVI